MVKAIFAFKANTFSPLTAHSFTELVNAYVIQELVETKRAKRSCDIGRTVGMWSKT